MKSILFLRQRLDGRSAPEIRGVFELIGSLDVAWRGYISGSSYATSSSRLASAYLQWQTELATHVFGEFALALYDHAEDALFVTNDDLGIVPLFYAEINGELIVSSHLDQIVSFTGVGCLDEEYIADYISQGYHLGPRTPYENIRRLLPGQGLMTRRGSVTISQTSRFNEDPIQPADPSASDERLLELITEAVTGSAQQGDHVWCELSGGLDSTTILSLAALNKTPGLAAFSFIYERSKDCDERKWIRPVLAKYPVPWHTIDADSILPFSDLPASRWAEPATTMLWSSREEAYQRLLREHSVDVVLSGEGGDAVLRGGMPRPYHLADTFRRGHFRDGKRELLRWANEAPEKRSPMYWFLRYVLRPSVRFARRQTIEHEVAQIPWISSKYARERQLTRRGLVAPWKSGQSVSSSAYMQSVMLCAFLAGTRHRDPNCLLRHPLLYRPLIEFMLRVSPPSPISPSDDRQQQRAAFAEILPTASLRRRDKQVISSWVYRGMSQGRAFREFLVRDARVVARGYVDKRDWDKAVADAAIGNVAA